jgi:hypothetical protein
MNVDMWTAFWLGVATGGGAMFLLAVLVVALGLSRLLESQWRINR